MAFQASNWGIISSSGNTQITLQNGTVIGAPAIYTYQSPTDNTAAITAVDYFVTVDVNLAVGDLIFIIATDGSEWYNVLAVDVDTGNIVIGVSPSTGDVTGPASSIDGQVAVFNGTTGKLLRAVTLPDVGWTVSAASPVSMLSNTSYIANLGTLLTFNMPATAAVGDVFEVAGNGSGGWLVQMNTGQVANLNSIATSSAGSIASTNRYNGIKILCTVANTTFVAISSEGSLTLA